MLLLKQHLRSEDKIQNSGCEELALLDSPSKKGVELPNVNFWFKFTFP